MELYEVMDLSKKRLRDKMQEIRTALSPAIKVELDQRISRLLLLEILKMPIKTVHTYLPMSAEIDMLPIVRHLLESGVEVVAPKTLNPPRLRHLVLQDLVDLERGIYNTQFPKGGITFEGVYDLIMVPGLAFDALGNRLGYGKGYYDHFLKQHPNAVKIAACYAFQKVDLVPTDASDVSVDIVITEDCVYRVL